jgi:hypothetical protein
MLDRSLFLSWIRATWTGWLLGVPLIVILALLGEAVGIGGSQVLVGAGMGIGTGLLQGRIIRGVIHKSGPWFWSSAVGLALPFLVSDISKATGRDIGYSLPIFVALGGLIAGGLQALILRPHLRKAWLWVLASALGWTLAAGAALVAHYISRLHSLRGLSGALIYLVVVAVGGLILGSVTGLCLAWMLGHKPRLSTG